MILTSSISYPYIDFRITPLDPVARGFTRTWLGPTYVSSNLPFQTDLLSTDSNSSTPPHRDPAAILDPSFFHAKAVMLYKYWNSLGLFSSHRFFLVLQL